MKIAVLLTGRMCRFDEIYDRIKYVFDVNDNSVDYFCHTWNDDFIDLKSAASLEDIYQLLIPTDLESTINLIDPKKVCLSSNLEILDMIRDGVNHINNPQFNLSVEQILLYINNLAPQLSTYHAMQSLKSYVDETKIEYDVVIKWRHDMIAEQIDFQHEIKTDTVYTPYTAEDTIDDRFYYSNYSTMLRLLNQHKSLFNKELLYTFYHMSDLGDVNYKAVIDKFNHAWFLNRMLLASFKAAILELKLEEMYRHNNVVIFRKYFNKDADLKNLVMYNRRLFNHNYGWCRKILLDPNEEVVYRKILVAGCSQIVGTNVLDCLSEYNKFSWPNLLGEWSNSKIIDISKPDNSLRNIAYDILNYENFKKLSGIIIILPTIKQDHRDTNKLDYIGYLSYVILLANCCYIPIWISAGSQVDHDYITSVPNNTFNLNTEKRLYQYYNNMGLTQDNHLYITAHTDFFENVIKPWVTTNILDVERCVFDKTKEIKFKYIPH